MKKSLVLSLFCLLLLSAHAQKNNEIETRAAESGLVGSGDITNSPIQQFYGKQSFSQVDHLTGTANVQVPLFTIKIHNISIPLALSYSTKGLSKDQPSSLVGSNWQFNGECRISRMIIGQPDEGGYLTGDGRAAPTISAGDLNLDEKRENGFDGEPDLYMYELPTGLTGMFIINYNKEIVQIPYQDVKIEWKNNINYAGSYFIITDSQGIIYRFGVTDGARETTFNDNFKRSKNYISSWLLASVNSGEYNSIVSYTYKSLGTITTSTNNVLYTFKHKMVTGHPQTLDKEEPLLFFSSTKTLSLSKISWRDGTIKVNSDSEKINSLSLCNRWGDEYKKIVLDIAPYNIVSTKTFLNRVYQLNAGVETTIARFDYYFPENIDDTYVFADMTEGYDTYGFYNGKHDYNVNKYPSYSTKGDDLYNSPTAMPGTDREPNIYYAKFGSLKRIYYPESGYIEFEYEAHKRLQPQSTGQYSGRLTIGGLRIKKISEFNSKSTTPISSTSYEYDVEDGLAGGYIYTRFMHKAIETEKRIEPDFNNIYLIYQITKKPTGSYFDITGAAIHYPEVKEILADGSYSIYRYTSFADNNDESSTNKSDVDPQYKEDFTDKVRPSVRFYKRGLLTSLKKYSTNHEKVFEEKYTYESIPVAETECYNIFTSMSYRVTAPNMQNYKSIQCVGKYNWRSERVLLKNKVTLQGPTNSMKKEEYVYGPTDLRVREVIIRDTTSQTKFIKIYYPQDFGNDVDWNIQALKTTHRLSCPIAILSGWSKTSISEGIVNVYQGYYQPSEVRKFHPNAPQSYDGNSIQNAVKLYSFDKNWDQNPCQYTYDSFDAIESAKYRYSNFGTIYNYDYTSDNATQPTGIANNIDLSKGFHATSFEDYFYGTLDANAKTGNRILEAGREYHILIRGASDTDKFILTYWKRPVNSKQWEFVQTHFFGSYNLLSSDDIDELRAFPVNSVVTTATYNQDMTLNSETDANNRTTYYKYNALGMLVNVSNEEGVIMKTINY